MNETLTFTALQGSGDSAALAIDGLARMWAVLRWSGGTNVQVKVSEDGTTFDAQYTATVSPAWMEIPNNATHLKVTGVGAIIWTSAKLRAFNPNK